MKKIIMMAVMAVAAISANAQNEVGQFTLMPKAGINISKVTGGDLKSKVGFVGGVEAEYGIAESFGLSFGALYSMEGAKGDVVVASGEGASAYLLPDAKINLGYINIPILANYYPVKGLAFKAGIQPAFKVNAKVSKDGDSAKLTDVKSFNLSIPVGVSYEYAKVVLDFRYNIGLTKIVKDSEKGRNSTFAITLGYKFAL